MIRRFLKLAANCLLLIAVSAFAQQKPDVVTQKLTLQMQSPPQSVPYAGGAVVGNPGNATYYFWIVTDGPNISGNTINSQPFGPVQVQLAPSTLSAGDSILLTWQAAPGATSYDILRTPTSAMPGGGCVCAVATAQSGTSFNVTTNTVSGYSFTQTYIPGSLDINLTDVAGGLTGLTNPTINNVTVTGNPVQTLVNAALTGQSANISSTPMFAFSVPTTAQGYLVTVYEEVTTAATTSSTLPTVNVSYRAHNSNTLQTLSATPSNPTGNTVGSTMVQASFVLSLGANQNINVSTSSYASLGATAMQYSLHIHVVQLGLEQQ